MLDPVNSNFVVKNVTTAPLQVQGGINPQPSEKIVTTMPNTSGADALASYNKAALSKPKPRQLEPALPTILLPQAIKTLQGERVYSSTGHLDSIIRKTPENTVIYKMDVQAPNDAISKITTIDNKTGKPIRIQTNINNIQEGALPQTFLTEIYDFYPNSDNAKKLTTYYKGKLELVEETEYGANGYKKNYIIESGIPLIAEEFPQTNTLRVTRFDETGQVHSVETTNEGKHTSNMVIYKDGKPFKTSNSSKKIIPNNTGKNPLADKDIVPTQPYILGYDPKTLNGEKNFYTNGALERLEVKTEKGNISYTYEPGGKLIGISDNQIPGKEKIILFYEGIGNTELPYYSVEETLGDGIFKNTKFVADGTKVVRISDDNTSTEKCAVYAKEGYLSHYFEDNRKEKSIVMEFDANGNLLG